MKCEQCGTETNAGDNYLFYYGYILEQETTSQRTDNANITTITAKYRNLQPSDAVFLCHQCVFGNHLNFKARVNALVLIAVAIACFLSPFSVIFFGGNFSIELMLGTWVIGLLCGLLGFAWFKGYFNQYLKESKNLDKPEVLQTLMKEPELVLTGDMLAISLRSNQLRSAGYDAFLTRAGYKNTYTEYRSP